MKFNPKVRTGFCMIYATETNTLSWSIDVCHSMISGIAVVPGGDFLVPRSLHSHRISGFRKTLIVPDELEEDVKDKICKQVKQSLHTNLERFTSTCSTAVYCTGLADRRQQAVRQSINGNLPISHHREFQGERDELRSSLVSLTLFCCSCWRSPT
eukprot:748838-Hanusia_phi.AAC.8